MKSEEFAEGLAAAGLSALFFWGLRILPLLGVIAIPAGVLPLARLAGRRGPRALLLPALLAAGASAALAYGLASLGARTAPAAPGPSPLTEAFLEAAVYLGMIGVCAAAVGVSRRLDPSRAFIGLVVYGGAIAAGVWLAVPGVTAELRAGFETMARAWTDSLRQTGADAESIRALQASVEEAGTLATTYAPGLVTVFWIAVAAPAYFLGRRLARLPGSFSDFRIPPVFAGLFVISGAAAVLARGAWRHAAADVLAPLVVLYFLAGLSIITHFAQRFLRMRILRAAFYVAASVAPFSALTAGLGLFDWYFDFRRRAGREEKE